MQITKQHSSCCIKQHKRGLVEELAIPQKKNNPNSWPGKKILKLFVEQFFTLTFDPWLSVVYLRLENTE